MFWEGRFDTGDASEDACSNDIMKDIFHTLNVSLLTQFNIIDANSKLLNLLLLYLLLQTVSIFITSDSVLRTMCTSYLSNTSII